MNKRNFEAPAEKGSGDKESLSLQQERYRDKLIETVRKAPSTYVPLRDYVDRKQITRAHADEVLVAWRKVIQQQEDAYRQANGAEVERILREEKVTEPKYTYPNQYQVKDISQQFDMLRERLALYENEGTDLPSDILENDSRYHVLSAELRKRVKTEKGYEQAYPIDGIFYIPPIYFVARVARKLYPAETNKKPDDEVALWYVLRRLRDVREEQGLKPFNNYLGENIDPTHLRLAPRAALAHATNELHSNPGLTFWPIQTGKARIESPRRSLLDLKNDPQKYAFKEAPLDVYSIACLMLSHPERANHVKPEPDLFIWAIGSQRSPKAGGSFGFVPYWYWGASELDLHSNWADYVDESYGGTSAFLPE